MEDKDLKMNIKISLVLNEVIELLLNDENGKQRKLPFRLQMLLNRNRSILEKDVSAFKKRKTFLVAKYGEYVEDRIVITDKSKMEQYKKEIEEVLNTEVQHNIVKISLEEFCKVTDSIDISNDALTLLQAYMVDDDKYLEDIQTEINFKSYEAPKKNKSCKESKKDKKG